MVSVTSALGSGECAFTRNGNDWSRAYRRAVEACAKLSCKSALIDGEMVVQDERGVTDFTQEPTDHFYGTDMGIRDPFGNPIRILQQGKAAQKATA